MLCCTADPHRIHQVKKTYCKYLSLELIIEIIYGKFERQIIIPISVTNRESVKISSKNGVLIIVIDKEREERNRFSIRVSPARSEDSE